MVYLGASISPWYQSSVPNVPRSRNPNEERKHYNIQGLQYQNISKYIKHPYILYYHYHISSYIIYVPYQMVVQSGYFEENKMPQHWYRGTAWLARRLVVLTAEAKLRAKTKALRGSQSHMSRALSATKDSWSRTSLEDTLDTLPTSDTAMTGSSKKHQPMSDQSLSF